MKYTHSTLTYPYDTLIQSYDSYYITQTHTHTDIHRCHIYPYKGNLSLSCCVYIDCAVKSTNRIEKKIAPAFGVCIYGCLHLNHVKKYLVFSFFSFFYISRKTQHTIQQKRIHTLHNLCSMIISHCILLMFLLLLLLYIPLHSEILVRIDIFFLLR